MLLLSALGILAIGFCLGYCFFRFNTFNHKPVESKIGKNLDTANIALELIRIHWETKAYTRNEPVEGGDAGLAAGTLIQYKFFYNSLRKLLKPNHDQPLLEQLKTDQERHAQEVK